MLQNVNYFEVFKSLVLNNVSNNLEKTREHDGEISSWRKDGATRLSYAISTSAYRQEADRASQPCRVPYH